jgi:hypothetical protein
VFQQNILFYKDKHSPASVVATVTLWAVESLRRWKIEERAREIREMLN